MNFLFILALALNAATYESVRATSGEQGKMLMTPAQFSKWASEFKSAREKAAACVTIDAGMLPLYINPKPSETFDSEKAALYDPLFIFITGHITGDIDAFGGAIGHAAEKKGCGLWSHVSELKALKLQLQNHSGALVAAYEHAQQNGRNFAAYTPEKRKTWLEDGFLDDYKNAVTAAVDAGELDVVRQGLASNSQMRARATNWSIFALRDKRFTNEMEKSLESDIVDTRMEAVYYFFVLKEPRVMDKVAALAGDAAVKVRQVVALYLGGVKASKHKAVLEKLAGDADPQVRQMAAEALKALR